MQSVANESTPCLHAAIHDPALLTLAEAAHVHVRKAQSRPLTQRACAGDLRSTGSTTSGPRCPPRSSIGPRWAPMRICGPQGPRHLLAAPCHVPRVLARLPWRRPPAGRSGHTMLWRCGSPCALPPP